MLRETLDSQSDKQELFSHCSHETLNSSGIGCASIAVSFLPQRPGIPLLFNGFRTGQTGVVSAHSTVFCHDLLQTPSKMAHQIYPSAAFARSEILAP